MQQSPARQAAIRAKLANERGAAVCKTRSGGRLARVLALHHRKSCARPGVKPAQNIHYVSKSARFQQTACDGATITSLAVDRPGTLAIESGKLPPKSVERHMSRSIEMSILPFRAAANIKNKKLR